MKKLIAMLNTFALLSSTVTSVVSCSEEKGESTKTSKEHKQDEQDNEKNDNNEDNKTEQSLASIMEQIKTNITVANIRADNTNTTLELTNEVKNRVEKIIEGKSVSFKLTINNSEQSESKLEEKVYQFNINLNTITSQDDKKEENSLSGNFSIAVKSLDINVEQQQMIKQLEQLDQQIEVILLRKVLIADGVNTYKDVKDMIKTELTNLALSKDTILQIEFIDSIFKEDNELIYKSDNPFEVKIDLIAKEDNQLSLSKTYKITTVEGLTKEYLQDKKDKDLQYNAIREVIKNMFANEIFTENILTLVNIKADGEHTVKDLITALNKLDNAKVFGENQNINKYKFQYNTVLELDDKLVLNKNLSIDVYVFDEDANQPFFKTESNFRILGENDLEQYERLTEKIKRYLNNKELDLSPFKELNADGKVHWNQTLSRIVKPYKIYNYFNFKLLGDDFKTEYANVVDFDLALDSEKENDLDNNYFTYNSEEKYVSVKLKLLRKGSLDPIYKEKNVDLKIKVGGLTDQRIYQIQEQAAGKLGQLIDHQKFEFTKTTFFEYWNSTSWEDKTYRTMIDYYLGKICDDDKEILEYLDFDATMTSKTNSEVHSINDYIFDLAKSSVTTEIHVSPLGRNNWKNNRQYNFHIMKNMEDFNGSSFKNIRIYLSRKLDLQLETEFFKSHKSLQFDVIFHKKDAINGKQLTNNDLYNKFHELIKNFIDKASPYMKYLSRVRQSWATTNPFITYLGIINCDLTGCDETDSFDDDSSELKEGEYELDLSDKVFWFTITIED